MANQPNRGGQNAGQQQQNKPGQPSHKNEDLAGGKHASPESPSRGGSHEQREKIGQPDQKNDR